MAVLAALIAKRQNVNDNDDTYCDYYGCYSSWNSWGRWVALVVIIVALVLLAFGLSCLQSRRRRRQGLQPMYGTGWMAKPPPYGQHNNYYPNQPYNNAPPPPMYTPAGVPPQQTGSTFRSANGYYGNYAGQDQGIELQQPASAYQRGGDNVYSAPEGPPPGKKVEGDAVIR